MRLLPVGIKGLVFAALIAAIVSSLASMMNSISTIFTMDFYRYLGDGEKSEHHLVLVGRTVSFTALVVAMLVAKPLLGKFPQAFQYIQNFTGFFTPGVVALFLLGIFWKRTTANAALGIAIGSFVLSLGFFFLWRSLPFLDRVGIVFLASIAIGIVITVVERAEPHPNAIDYEQVDTSTSSGFNFSALVIILILTALYATWW
jgi:SSS family solute:Na+ symporter